MKPRKNPWIKRKAKEKFQETLRKIEDDPKVKTLLKEHSSLLKDINKATKEVEGLTKKYVDIANKLKIDENMIQDLSISSLKDLIDVENTGRVQKAQFKDVIKAGVIKKEALEAVDDKDELLTKSKELYIDLLQAKINALIDVLSEEKDEA